MPAPIALLGAGALYEAAVATLTVIGVATGVIAADELINEKEKDRAGATTADSTRPCDKCPAIPKVASGMEYFTGKKKSRDYQMRICGTYSERESDGRYKIQAFIFSDFRLSNPKKVVSFDGWKPERCLFLEAKGEYDQFFKNGEPWYSKAEDSINQAGRQQIAIDLCENIPRCHWHFMEPVSYRYYKREFLKFPDITVFHT